MEKHIAIIGSGEPSIETIEALLEAKGMNDVIVVNADDIATIIKEPPVFKIIEAPPMILTPDPIQYQYDYKDGRAKRRERRKQERKKHK